MLAFFALFLLAPRAQEPIEPETSEAIVEDAGEGMEIASVEALPVLGDLLEVEESQDPWQNPAQLLSPLEFGLMLDFFAAFTEKADSDEAYNEVRIRSARMHLRAPVDAHTQAWTTMDFGDTGSGAEFQLREAALRVDRLPLPGWPERFHLLVGQYYADLGPWNTVLPGEFFAPQMDGFRRLYLGGNLAARGIEAHHLIPMRNARLRWSLGFASEFEGHNPDANDFGIPATASLTPFGRSGLRNWAGTGRVEGVWYLGDGRSARAGGSLLYSPGEVKFTEVPGFGVMRDETEHVLGGVDFGYRQELSPERAHEVSLELWMDDSEYRVGTPSVLVGESEAGQSLLYRYQHDQEWSFGGMLSRFDQPSPGADVDGHYHSLWSSYQLSERNRVTLFLTHTNPAQGEQKWFTVGAQWTIELGVQRDAARRTWD